MATQPTAQHAARETGWLIEGSHLFDRRLPRWWHPVKGWVLDASEALRFARKDDAEQFAHCLTHGAGGVATEHVFIGALNYPAIDELEDLLADAINDSMDMDWTGRVGAKAIIRALEREGYALAKSEAR